MLLYYIGIIGFVLFFLGDINDLHPLGSWAKASFWCGSLLLLAAVGSMCISGERSDSVLVLGAAGTLAVLFFFLTMISLFGSFSREEGYMNPGEKRQVYTRGMYALCRHPGVLWFMPLMGMLAIWGLPLKAALTYSLFNILLGLFEDRIVFPSVLKGYREYQGETPFLIPNFMSMKKCWQDLCGERNQSG